MRVYDRQLGTLVEEEQFAESLLNFLYNTIIGRALLSIFIQPFTTRILSVIKRSAFTKKEVERYIYKYSINPDEYTVNNWQSFAEFFKRQYKTGKITVATEQRAVIAIAESKVLAVPVSNNAILSIKHRDYDLATILGSRELAAGYQGGVALVYRLSVHNYHRYIFPDDGRYVSRCSFKGVLHTVSSISERYPVYSVNQREVSILETDHFGEIAYVEVGAMLAGKIVNQPLKTFMRGQEKGGFELGGSSILVIYKKSTITLDPTVSLYSDQGIEVTVAIGEKIGNHV